MCPGAPDEEIKSGPCDPPFFKCPATVPGDLMKRHPPLEKSLKRRPGSDEYNLPPEVGPPDRQSLNIVQQSDHIFRFCEGLA